MARGSTPHWSTKAMKYTDETIAEAVKASVTYAEAVRFLNPRFSGTGWFKRRVQKLGLDTSHFVGQAHAKGKPNLRDRKPWQELLVVRQSRLHTETLRRAMLESGVPWVCTKCGQGGVWDNKPLVLEIDHINGCNIDCRPENLRFLCPNCHSQTPTFRSKNRTDLLPKTISLSCVGCRTAIIRKGSVEANHSRTRKNGPFCPTCKGRNNGRRKISRS